MSLQIHSTDEVNRRSFHDMALDHDLTINYLAIKMERYQLLQRCVAYFQYLTPLQQ